MWSMKRMPGERMWITITYRDGDNLTGTLENWPVFYYLVALAARLLLKMSKATARSKTKPLIKD